MNEKRYGRQDPIVSFTLPYTQSRGQEAIDLYNKTGRTALPWQESLLFDMLAVNDDELWTHSKFGYSVPRQNGKNEVVAMRELFGLLQGERILHTAHRTSTSRSAWERLVFLLNALGIEEKCAANPDGFTSGKSKGQEFIFMPEAFGSGRIQFRTRTTTGGLGETFDLLVIDEAQEYQDDHESALKYTIVTSENPQTILLGTPPTAYSSGTIFPKYRKDTLCGSNKYCGWAEWSVESQTDINDIDTWYDTNPSLGYKLTERAIESELGSDEVDFNIQRFGLWITYNQHSEISEDQWNNCFVQKPPHFESVPCIGIKYAKDGSNVSMAIAAKTKDGIFTEVIGCKPIREGNDWIVATLRKLRYLKVIVDGTQGQTVLTKAMKDGGLKSPYLPSVREFIEANARFEQHLTAQEIQHCGQPALKQIVTNCEKRHIGSSGGFGYQSIMVGADISLLDSIILAMWGAENFKETKKQKIVY